MKIIEYYESEFQKDLSLLLNSTEKKQDRISIVSLTETKSAPSFYGVVRRAFQQLNEKPSFLTCYFYTTLLDQAIHSYDKNLHYDFDRVAGYPKFVGILSSYWSNLEPPLLLLIATLHIKNKEDFIKQFTTFTKYILNDYIVFFNDVFPEYTIYLEDQESINIAIKSIFHDIEISVTKDTSQTTIWNTKIDKEKIEIYYELIDILQRELKIVNKG